MATSDGGDGPVFGWPQFAMASVPGALLSLEISSSWQAPADVHLVGVGSS